MMPNDLDYGLTEVPLHLYTWGATGAAAVVAGHVWLPSLLTTIFVAVLTACLFFEIADYVADADTPAKAVLDFVCKAGPAIAVYVLWRLL